MGTAIKTSKKKSKLKLLPSFALFLRDEKLDELVIRLWENSKKLNISFLSYFNEPEHKLREMLKLGTARFLTFLVEDNVDELSSLFVGRWKSGQFPNLPADKVKVEDILLSDHARKQTFLDFIPEYLVEPREIIELVKEINDYTIQLEASSIQAYIDILQLKIHEHIHLIEKINTTTPGITYVYDILENKEIYTNKKIADFLGYTEEDLKGMGEEKEWKYLIHPSDRFKLKRYEREFLSVADGEVRSIEFRIKNKQGEYKWLRLYESAFRRTEKGTLWQKIGIATDIHKEKEIAEQLAYSEEQLLEAQEISGIGSFEWDFNTRNTAVTPQVLKILNLTEITSLGDFLNNVHPSDRNKFQAAIEKSLKEKEVFECEYRYLNGEEEKIVWARGIVKHQNNIPVSFKGTVMDVTERRHMVFRLQRSEELYKQAEVLSGIGNWTWDIHRNKITWTDGLYRIYGLEPQSKEMTFSHIVAFVHPDDIESAKVQLRKTKETFQTNDFFYRIILPDKTVKTLHARGEVLLDSNKKLYKMFGTVQDVTNEKLVESQLLEKQNLIQKIADTTPSIIAAYNINTGKYLFISKALEQLLGYGQEEVFTEGVAFFINLIHPDDLGPMLEKNQKALDAANQDEKARDSMIVEFQYRMRHKTGQYRWFHTYSTIFDRDTNNRIELMLDISIDITERVEAEKKLSQKTLELQQSNTNLQEFAYVASHDLKEPLRKISAFGERLFEEEYEQMKDDSRIYLKKIIDSSKRMQKLIDDLLSFSLISSNKSFEPYSIQTVLKEVLRTFEYKIEKTNAVVSANNLPKINMIPSQFRQLFQNLIGNSLKFVQDGVPPEIAINYKYLKASEVKPHKLIKSSRYLQLTLSDNGIGFSPEFSEKIFAIFQRLHGRSEFEGTGIGLAICKKIVEHHGGTIFAAGEKNKGATFTIILPV